MRLATLPLLLAFCPASLAGQQRQTIVIVIGAPGAPEYAAPLLQSADRLERAAAQADAEVIRLGDGQDDLTDLARLQATLSACASPCSEPLWLVLIGHGTFDGQLAKFNLRGPDVSAQQLADWLEPCQRPVAVINCASSSGPFINRLSAPNRVVVTAAKSGFEQNFSRFGQYFSEAITDPASDLDKDQQTSLLEAFLAASAKVAEFYQGEARLATEHALLDDNGDGLGTPSDWFRGVRAVRSPKEGAQADGSRAHQLHLIRSQVERDLPSDVRTRRDQLELEVIRLRDQKQQFGEDDYYRQLENLLLQLARLYQDLEAKGAER